MIIKEAREKLKRRDLLYTQSGERIESKVCVQTLRRRLLLLLRQPRKGKLASRSAPSAAELRFPGHVQSRQRFHLLAVAPRGILFLLVYQDGSEEFLQRHNSRRGSFRPASAYRRLRYKKVRPVPGIPRIPSRQRWSSVWNLADGRKNEQAGRRGACRGSFSQLAAS